MQKRVKDYIDLKGNNHHKVFLLDVVGQYIGADSKLMLNLSDSKEANTHVLNDVLHFISGIPIAHETSMKMLKDRFMKVSYGFVEDAVFKALGVE